MIHRTATATIKCPKCNVGDATVTATLFTVARQCGNKHCHQTFNTATGKVESRISVHGETPTDKSPICPDCKGRGKSLDSDKQMCRIDGIELCTACQNKEVPLGNLSEAFKTLAVDAMKEFAGSPRQ